MTTFETILPPADTVFTDQDRADARAAILEMMPLAIEALRKALMDPTQRLEAARLLRDLGYGSGWLN